MFWAGYQSYRGRRFREEVLQSMALQLCLHSQASSIKRHCSLVGGDR
jgi:hypothetical protein